MHKKSRKRTKKSRRPRSDLNRRRFGSKKPSLSKLLASRFQEVTRELGLTKQAERDVLDHAMLISSIPGLLRTSHWVTGVLELATCEHEPDLVPTRITEIIDGYIQWLEREGLVDHLCASIQRCNTELFRRGHADDVRYIPTSPTAKPSVIGWEASSYALLLFDSLPELDELEPDGPDEPLCDPVGDLIWYLAETDGVPVSFKELDTAAYAAFLHRTYPTSPATIRGRLGIAAQLLKIGGQKLLSDDQHRDRLIRELRLLSLMANASAA